MDEIHIWKFPTKDISILLNETFLNKIKTELKNRYKSLPTAYKQFRIDIPYSTFKGAIFQPYKIFRSLWLMLVLCEKLELPYQDLEKNVLSYRTKRGRIIVVNPVLPIRLTPIFDMLIAHTIADGNCTNYKKRIPAFNYRQYRNEILNLYRKKVERVFGKLEFTNEYFFKSKRIYIPSSISSILYTYYKMRPDDFLENKAKLPDKMLKKSETNLLSVLIAFILDEGYIDSSNIIISLKNKTLIYNLRTICNRLGFENRVIDKKERSIIYILSEGVKKFWDDYKKLKREYPEIDLDYKERQIENFILRKKKNWRSAKQGETQNQTIALLKESDKSIKELSVILQISRQGMKFHIRKLEKKGIVEKTGIGYAQSHIYKLKKYVRLPVKKKSRSRQYGVTDKNIIRILKEKPLTTKELADKLKINRATLLNILYRLEKKKMIKQAGKKVLKTHPSIIWSVE